jgi:hypothetical protein
LTGHEECVVWFDVEDESVFFCEWLGCATPRPMGYRVNPHWADRHVPQGWRSFVAFTVENKPELVIACTLECYEQTREAITRCDPRYRWVRLLDLGEPRTRKDEK